MIRKVIYVPQGTLPESVYAAPGMVDKKEQNIRLYERLMRSQAAIPTFVAIEVATARYFELPTLLRKTRDETHVKPRRYMYYYAINTLKLPITLSEVGRLSDKHHTSIMHHLEVMEGDLHVYKQINGEYSRYCQFMRKIITPQFIIDCETALRTMTPCEIINYYTKNDDKNDKK